MVATYQIFGRSVQSHWLAIATLGGTYLGTVLATGGKKVADSKGPPINAGSKDEESFIQDFLKQNEPKREGHA